MTMAVLAVVLCLILLPTQAQAASESDLTFELNYDGESYSVSDCNYYASGELVIPATYNGKPVTSIGSSAFERCTSLTSVTIGNGVTTIGSSAFEECTSLTSVTIGNGVTTVGASAFGRCFRLTDVYITDLAAWCNISFDNDWASPLDYGENLYLNGQLVTDLAIPEGVVTIGAYAFGSLGLTSITIPDSVISIGESAIFGVTNVYITDLAAWCKIGFGNAYANPLCGGGNLYLNGRLVTDLVIPEGIGNIGDFAFCGCASLTSVNIPNGVIAIGNEAFHNCDSLTSITIPNSVTSIGDSAFKRCKNLASANIPYGVTSIGNEAFEICTSLTSVTISDSVTSIGEKAFCDCRSLTSLTLPNNDGQIGRAAFAHCESLTSITIPDRVTRIGFGAFSQCYSLCSVTIPDSVTSIGSYAFEDCTSLTGVIIPDSVTFISNSAFYGCTSLTSIIIPDSVTRVAYYAFFGCTNLTSVTIGNSVDTIEEKTFCRCDSLTSVTIPGSVTTIGVKAFDYCTSLTDIWYTGSASDKDAISIDMGNAPLTDAQWHYNICSAAHAYSGLYDTECNVCGYICGSEHENIERWMSDENTHWHYCTRCGMKADEAAHELGAGATACTVCGHKMVPTSDAGGIIGQNGANSGVLVWVVVGIAVLAGAVVAVILIRKKTPR